MIGHPGTREADQRCSRPGRCSGFTLTEILTVVAILAVLMILLFPAAAGYRESARAAECTLRLRNLGLALNNWRAQNDDRLVPSLVELSWRPSRHLFNAGAIASAKEMACPAVNTLQEGAWYDVTSPDGSAYRNAFLNRPLSYTINSLAFNQVTLPGSGSTLTSSYRMFIGKESQVPLFLDGRNWQLNRSSWQPEKRTTYIGFPHRGRANVVFLDGHIESIEREGALNLQPLGDDRRY